MLPVLQGRGDGRRKISKTLLSLTPHTPIDIRLLTGRTDNAAALRRRVDEFAELWLDPTWKVRSDRGAYYSSILPSQLRGKR